MNSARSFPIPILAAFALLLLPAASVSVSRAQDPAPAPVALSPWLLTPWRGTVIVPPGNYLGPKGGLPIGKDSKVVWQPGSQIENFSTDVGTGTPLEATGCQLRKVHVGLSLWSRLDLTDCLLDGCSFRKINPWFDTRNSSTKWRFTNCVITKSFMGGSFTFLDCSVRAVNCTFLDLKMPAIHYRDGKVAEQAQQETLKFENCRFVNCEINERFLASTVDCAFENCRYTGTEKKFATSVNGPVEVKAYWSGKNPETSYTRGNFKVSFLSVAPPFKAGSTLSHTTKDDRITLTAINPPGSLVILGSTPVEKPKPKTDPAGPQNPFDPAEPAKPENIPAKTPGSPPSAGDNVVITGTVGAPAIPLGKSRSAVNALLVVELPGQGVAGAAAKLSALALPIDPQASTEVTFNVKVGPMMITALREVVKCLQVRHQGWPRGQRIELAFEDKFVPKDGPSAAVACALLLDSMLGNWEIDPAIAVTGDLNADGSVQPIGGVSGKIRGATKAGCTRVAVPVKNAEAVGDVLLTDSPEPLARIEVFSITTLDDAIALARRPPAVPPVSGAVPIPAAAAETGPENPDAPPTPAPATPASEGTPARLFQEVRRALLPGDRWNAAALRDRGVVTRLRELLRLQPNDLSARYLLAAATNTGPSRLTLRGSIESMDQISVSLLTAIKAKEAAAMTKTGGDQVGDAVYKLKRVRTRMDARVLPTLDALTRFGEILRTAQNQPPRTQVKAKELYTSLLAAAKEADRQHGLLMKNREVVEELMR